MAYDGQEMAYFHFHGFLKGCGSLGLPRVPVPYPQVQWSWSGTDPCPIFVESQGSLTSSGGLDGTRVDSIPHGLRHVGGSCAALFQAVQLRSPVGSSTEVQKAPALRKRWKTTQNQSLIAEPTQRGLAFFFDTRTI